MAVNYHDVESETFTNLAEKVRRRYRFPEGLVGEHLKTRFLNLFASFGQEERPWNPQTIDDEVFKAAVWAIASNSRSWTNVVNNRLTIEKLLCKFRLEELRSELQKDGRRESLVRELAKALGGQTAGGDAAGIVSWAQYLKTHKPFAQNVLEPLRGWVGNRASAVKLDLTPQELTALCAAALGSPTELVKAGTGITELKTPRMGFILATEFLRNLGWSGFKPDRHIQALLALWQPQAFESASEYETRSVSLSRQIFGTSSKAYVEPLRCCLVGVAFTPREVKFMVADQVMWLYGSITARHKDQRIGRGVGIGSRI
jgi:hypothetical protein